MTDWPWGWGLGDALRFVERAVVALIAFVAVCTVLFSVFLHIALRSIPRDYLLYLPNGYVLVGTTKPEAYIDRSLGDPDQATVPNLIVAIGIKDSLVVGRRIGGDGESVYFVLDTSNTNARVALNVAECNQLLKDTYGLSLSDFRFESPEDVWRGRGKWAFTGPP